MDEAGAVTSLLIIAFCFAGIHTIVNIRREQARRLGVPYMDPVRRTTLVIVGGIALAYFGFVAIAAAGGW